MTRKYFVKEGNGVTSEYSSKAAYKRIKKRAKVFGAMHARNWKALRKAERDGDVQAIIDAATYAIRFYDNGARFPQTIRHVFQFGNKTAKNPETFWPILIELWDSYDWMCAEDMWWLKNLIRLMDGHKPGSGLEYLENDGSFYNTLPDIVTVYRGCARKHVKGIAWTTDFETALFFAGRCNTAADDPVIVTGRIALNDPKLYFASNERAEFEIVCQPEIISIEPQSQEVLEAAPVRRAVKNAVKAHREAAELAAQAVAS
jgi:hypothetical protein